jgi:uncharacterized protein
MPMAIAEKAIAHFHSHNRKSSFISLGFYGGEPLVAFDEIRATTDLCQHYERGHETHYHMTTNGTVLTREKWSFLIDNNFGLLISLDGPLAVHDRYRRNVGGQGTYRTIVRNLTELRKYAPDYYENRVMFSCVRAPATSMKMLARFFSTHPLIRGRSAQVSGVSPGCPLLMTRLLSDVKDWDELRRADGDLKHEYLRRVATARTRGGRFRFLQDVYGKPFIKLHRRRICAGPRTSVWLNGMCMPATRKLFVAADGSLHTCERVGRSYPIGHVDTGVDLDRVYEMLEKHNAFHDRRCRECWAVRLCGACQSTIGGPEGVDPARAQAFCAEERDRISDTILSYVQVLEANPRAWDFIEEISVS